jgi:hypothetical protein
MAGILSHPHLTYKNQLFTLIRGDESILEHFVPENHQYPDPDSPLLNDIWFLNWTSNLFPFMPLVPIHRQFSGPLFQCLDYTSCTLPIGTNLDGSWGMHPEVVQEWVALERNMHALFLAMMEVNTIPMPNFF